MKKRKRISSKEKEARKRRKRVLQKRRENPKRYILCRIKGNAKLRDLPCPLTEADIPDIPNVCPVFPWIKIEYKVGHQKKGTKGKAHMFNSPSLDRIDNTKGYFKDNIRIISFKANWLKGSATHQELMFLAADSLKNQEIISQWEKGN